MVLEMSKPKSLLGYYFYEVACVYKFDYNFGYNFGYNFEGFVVIMMNR